MGEHVALRCANREAAEAAALCLGDSSAGVVLSVRAVAVVWLDRASECHVRHGFPPRPNAPRSWACWMLMSVAMLSGGMVDAALFQTDTPLPEVIDEVIVATVAERLEPGRAAIVVTLGEPTPLLLVEAVRRHVRGLLWSTLTDQDRELISAMLRTSPRC